MYIRNEGTNRIAFFYSMICSDSYWKIFPSSCFINWTWNRGSLSSIIYCGSYALFLLFLYFGESIPSPCSINCIWKVSCPPLIFVSTKSYFKSIGVVLFFLQSSHAQLDFGFQACLINLCYLSK